MSYNIPQLYVDVLQAVRYGEVEPSRNGMVKTITNPVIFIVEAPTERVLFDSKRQANPYFHVMETVWMLAGQQRVEWLLQFNKGMADYADNGYINGAYGHRWRNGWPMDQIVNTVRCFRDDPTTRQAVIAMWNPYWDIYPNKWKDRPCNTHLYFRITRSGLDMTVCNRSNDVVWGLAGANAVHMTYLQELISRAIDVPVGFYYVMTNNLHLYEHHWHLADHTVTVEDYYEGFLPQSVTPYPILQEGEDYLALLAECERFVKEEDFRPKNNWLRHVAMPMRDAYITRKAGGDETKIINQIAATDWRKACFLWQDWHNGGTG